jgi:hypothetical protein
LEKSSYRFNSIYEAGTATVFLLFTRASKPGNMKRTSRIMHRTSKILATPTLFVHHGEPGAWDGLLSM